MADFYVVEFPNEADPKSRGPHIVQEHRVRLDDNAAGNVVEVKWNVLNSEGEVSEAYFTAISLHKGTRKACADFMDKIRRNREIAEVTNKEGRARKKSAKLMDQDDTDDLFALNDSWNLSGPPRKKQKKSSSSSSLRHGKDESDVEKINGNIIVT